MYLKEWTHLELEKWYDKLNETNKHVVLEFIQRDFPHLTINDGFLIAHIIYETAWDCYDGPKGLNPIACLLASTALY